jgi:hypothetical protein
MNMNLEDRIKSVISQYDPISLEEMDQVRLMRRTDTKFVFNLKYLPHLLGKAADRYMMVEIAGEREQIYHTTYFDTSNYDMYQLHHNGKLNRHKVRIRKYLYTQQEFLEIKRKNNKGETVKTRIEHAHPGLVPGIVDKGRFIENNTPYQSHALAPTLGNNFIRLTLVNKDFSERITLDYQLSFTDLKYNNQSAPSEICIAEIKKGRYNKTSPFIHLLRQMGINSMGFSKYCMGLAMLNPEVKNNLFKQKIRSIVKV